MNVYLHFKNNKRGKYLNTKCYLISAVITKGKLSKSTFVS